MKSKSSQVGLQIAIATVISVLAVAGLAGCGAGDDETTASSSSASSTSRARGIEASLEGIEDQTISGKLEMPGFPYGDELRLHAKAVGQAQGEREYAVWGRQGRTMILLGTWPVGHDGNLQVDDDLSMAKMFLLVRKGDTTILITRANTDRLWAAMAARGEFVEPHYVGTKVLEGPLEGPGVAAAQE